jgi:hypothetical protein
MAPQLVDPDGTIKVYYLLAMLQDCGRLQVVARPCKKVQLQGCSIRPIICTAFCMASQPSYATFSASTAVCGQDHRNARHLVNVGIDVEVKSMRRMYVEVFVA